MNQSVTLQRASALTARRTHLGIRRFVVILVGNRPVAYPFGKSKIQFIGTTKDGITGLAGVIAKQTDPILRQTRVTSFEARLVTCSTGRTPKAWAKLQRELVLGFQELFGVPPVGNRPVRLRARNRYFDQERLVKILRELS